MQHEAVAATANAYAAAIHLHGQKIAPGFGAAAIHRFRVEAKRLGALVRLSLAEDDGLEIKPGKRFKTLYSALGIVRDAQLQLERVVKAAPPALPEYALWLAARIGRGQLRWAESYAEKVTFRLQARLADVAWPDLQPSTLRRFVTSHLAGIGDTLAHPDLADEVLHDVRKRVKDLQHILKWAGKSWPEGIAALDGFSLSAIESVAERAGEYNDERMAIESLEGFMVRNGEKKSGAEAAELLQRWRQSRDHNRAALVEALDALRSGSPPDEPSNAA